MKRDEDNNLGIRQADKQSEKQVVRGFAVFIALLVVHFAYVGWAGQKYSEPWPALVMPGFKEIYAVDEEITLQNPRFYAHFADSGKSKEQVYPEQLFEGLQFSQLSGFLRTHFRDTTYSEAQKSWLQMQVGHLFPERRVATLSIEWMEQVYQSDHDTVRLVRDKQVHQITIPLSRREALYGQP